VKQVSALDRSGKAITPSVPGLPATHYIQIHTAVEHPVYTVRPYALIVVASSVREQQAPDAHSKQGKRGSAQTIYVRRSQS
jgi:hypothetical protein